VGTPLCPVDAAAGEDAPRRHQAVGLDAHLPEEFTPVISQDVITLIDETEGAHLEETIAQLDTAAAGQVVITGSGLGESHRVVMLTEGTDGRVRRDLRQRLQ
jgi:hypothetical protein